jgi:hypothetical protein
MKKILLPPVISTLLFCAPAFADYAKGLDAAQKGDFVTALKDLLNGGMPKLSPIWVRCTIMKKVLFKTTLALTCGRILPRHRGIKLA